MLIQSMNSNYKKTKVVITIIASHVPYATIVTSFKLHPLTTTINIETCALDPL